MHLLCSHVQEQTLQQALLLALKMLWLLLLPSPDWHQLVYGPAVCCQLLPMLFAACQSDMMNNSVICWWLQMLGYVWAVQSTLTLDTYKLMR